MNRYISLSSYQAFLRGQRLEMRSYSPMYVPCWRGDRGNRILPSCLMGGNIVGEPASPGRRKHRGNVLLSHSDSGRRKRIIESIVESARLR